MSVREKSRYIVSALDTSAASERVRMGAARILVEDMAVRARLGLAVRAQAIGIGEGARSPAGPARAPVELVEIVEATGDGGSDRRTPLGYRTARSALPRVLGALPESDARRRAARRYATLHELVVTMPAPTREDASACGRASDGGVVWRVGLASELKSVQAAIGQGWALRPVRSDGRREAISLRSAVDAVCLQGAEIKSVLRAHGWSPWGQPVRMLSDAVLEVLYRVADVPQQTGLTYSHGS